MAAKKTSSKKTAAKAKKPSQKPATKAKKNSTASKSTRAKSAPSNDVKAQESRRFWSVIIFCIGILELFITFVHGDGLWTKLYELNRGLFGVSVFLVAPIIIYVAIMIATDKAQHTVIAKIVQGLILMLLISSAAQILFVGNIAGQDAATKL
ncbi:MAG: DNA translocase FtsK, partial [Ruminococcus sp.]|nr:DNA translocase FtsK [Ruminococcus sp.]